ncbi:NAD-dependent epimerase/dehydratase family protein [Occallatibacter riparius]|uniref:NAD(P)-dependent oxidoreductase n=1 Tax=Occallatibacter riparius TaxID=1002689 RepID=A0A9J7BME3_9BACT|nr:NAD(P)-dependent oxidoreductase [Occallatibacter riparius]UWZ84052.1 NAD(P)-dependent oxidoreductase [Occallatibacter riparius]
MKRILVTGATGKVGSHFIRRVLQSEAHQDVTIRALCHNRLPESHQRLEIVRGTISDRDTVRSALQGVTHVIHCATCKETPDSVMDVAVKGLFWLLEECRLSESFRHVVLIGGDAALGHFVYPHPLPVTEQQRHSAYPGCYALSKVLEEVMLEQYFIQYNLSGCCLRAPWIMEKDDFKYSLSFDEDVFGGPRWRELVGAERAGQYIATNTVPLMVDPLGKPVKRNFVHVSDLVDCMILAMDHPNARQQTFNICMDEPVDYGQVAEYLWNTRSMPSIVIKTEYWSTWLDNSKAKFLLGWRPRFDLARLIEDAWSYQRSETDPRHVWYPG